MIDLSKLKLGTESTDVEKDLPFKMNPELFNGIARGYLTDISVVERELAKYNDKGEEQSGDYAGLLVKNLKFTFIQDPVTVNGERRVFTHYTSLVNFKTKDGNDIESKVIYSLVGTEYGRVRHILNVMGIKDLTPLDLGRESATDRASVWNEWIDEIGDLVKPVIGDFSKKLLWIKLLVDYRTHKYLELPSFLPITPFLEVVTERNAKQPGLELGVNESIILWKEENGKSGNMAGSPIPPKTQDNLDPALKSALGI